MDGLSCIFDRFPLSLCNAEWFMPMIYRRIEAWIISYIYIFFIMYHIILLILTRPFVIIN